MSKIKRNIPGSKWWKFDFHTHTPASSGDYIEDVSNSFTPELWLQNAMQNGLDCVVVSDHNSGDWIDRLKEKNNEIRGQELKPDWYHELIIFPGAEITVADSNSRIHLLAVFGPECDSRKITGLLGACGIHGGYGDHQDTSTTTGFVETEKK